MGSPGGSPPIGPAHRPGPLAARLARFPRHLYRYGLGRLLGWRMVLIEHTGRRSGLPRQTVVEVVRRAERSVDVAAAWGDHSDWYRNLMADPTCRISTGSWRRRPAVASRLSPDAAAGVLAAYARDHPRAARALGKRFDLPFDDPDLMASAIPVLRLSVITALP